MNDTLHNISAGSTHHEFMTAFLEPHDANADQELSDSIAPELRTVMASTH